MQELINKIMSEVGLNSEQATKTVSTVIDFVKTKLPPALSGNIEAMFLGTQADTLFPYRRSSDHRKSVV